MTDVNPWGLPSWVGRIVQAQLDSSGGTVCKGEEAVLGLFSSSKLQHGVQETRIPAKQHLDAVWSCEISASQHIAYFQQQ